MGILELCKGVGIEWLGGQQDWVQDEPFPEAVQGRTTQDSAWK